ncbi:hypothetical protein HaLaN_08954, partial [Haematococcus lacustris]
MRNVLRARAPAGHCATNFGRPSCTPVLGRSQRLHIITRATKPDEHNPKSGLNAAEEAAPAPMLPSAAPRSSLWQSLLSCSPFVMFLGAVLGYFGPGLWLQANLAPGPVIASTACQPLSADRSSAAATPATTGQRHESHLPKQGLTAWASRAAAGAEVQQPPQGLPSAGAGVADIAPGPAAVVPGAAAATAAAAGVGGSEAGVKLSEDGISTTAT